MISRRNFLTLASGLLVPEPLRAYSFVGGWRCGVVLIVPPFEFNGIPIPEDIVNIAYRTLPMLYQFTYRFVEV